MMDPSKNYYALLGVLPSIDPAAIRAVYLALLKNYHPDVCKSGKDEATRRTKELNEAYNVLGDAKHRKQYDSLRADFCSRSKESYGEPRARQCHNKAKATNYRDPWTAKRRDSLQGADRLRVLAVSIVVSVALALIISAFAGSV